MKKVSFNHYLPKNLPNVRGSYTYSVEMAPFTWFRVGGAAEVVFRPKDKEDLANFLRKTWQEFPVTVIGAASNILIRDGGIPGIVIRLGKKFSEVQFESTNTRIGSGLLNGLASKMAVKNGFSGLEFLSGIPGTIGGGLRMNSGAYGKEFKDILLEAEVIDPLGNVHIMSVEQLDMSYRSSSLPKDWIFLSALFRTTPNEPQCIQKMIDEIQQSREASQPIREKTGGSTFKNPNGQKAWELIEAAGCRGESVGDAMVSEKHCNFLVNKGNASANDLESLGNIVRERVFKTSGIILDWEIRRLGISPHFAEERQGRSL